MHEARLELDCQRRLISCQVSPSMCLELLGIGVGMNFGVLFVCLWYLPLISTEVSKDPFSFTRETNPYLVNFRPSIKTTERREKENSF